MSQAQQEIQTSRADGFSQGRQYVAEHGYEAACKYFNQLADANGHQPSNQMYGYVDGFLNAVVAAKR